MLIVIWLLAVVYSVSVGIREKMKRRSVFGIL